MEKYRDASMRTKVGVNCRYKDDHVRVARSAFLANKGINGLGLYSQQRLKKGLIVGEFLGTILTVAEAEKKKRNKFYLFDVKLMGRVAYVIDGSNAKTSSVLRYVNAADTAGQQNAALKQYAGKIYMVLTKDVPKGRKILTWYGAATLDIVGHSSVPS